MIDPLSEAVLAELRATTSATLCTQLFKRGLRNCFMQGVRPLVRGPGPMIGRAYTLRNIPVREDLEGPGQFHRQHPQRRAIEECPAGAVLVIDARREAGAGTLGDILITRLMQRGVAGVVTDGGMRDIESMAGFAWPVYAAGPAAPASFHAHHAVDLQQPVGCGGIAVFPGDVLFGDGEGVVVIPQALAAEVARDAAAQERMEGWVLGEIRKGQAIWGLYPPDEAAQARFAAAERAAAERAAPAQGAAKGDDGGQE